MHFIVSSNFTYPYLHLIVIAQSSCEEGDRLSHHQSYIEYRVSQQVLIFPPNFKGGSTLLN